MLTHVSTNESFPLEILHSSFINLYFFSSNYFFRHRLHEIKSNTFFGFALEFMQLLLK